jgi:hypothetical protein
MRNGSPRQALIEMNENTRFYTRSCHNSQEVLMGPAVGVPIVQVSEQALIK